FAHAGGEVDQALLVGVGGVAVQGGDAGFYIDAFAVQVDVAACGAVLLDGLAGCAFGLVTHEHDVMARVAEHGFQVVDDAATGTHSAGGDDDGRARGLGQVVHHLLVVA